MALRGRKINNFLELWCLVSSGGLGIWVSSASFPKSNIGWPQQPPTEKVLISVKICIFDDTFYKKGPVLVILVPEMIQPSGLVFFLMEWGCKGHWGHGGRWGCRGPWGCWGLQSHQGNSALFWCLEKINFLVGSGNITLKISTFSVRGCWGQQMLLFWKLVDETQMPNPPKATRHHDSRKLLSLLPLRAI